MLGGYNCLSRARDIWQGIVARAKEAANPNRMKTYPLMVSFRAALTGNHMGEFDIEGEAAPKAHVMQLLTEMKEGKVAVIPPLPFNLQRYRLFYDGRELKDDEILDYIVAADNPTVTVLVSEENCSEHRRRR